MESQLIDLIKEIPSTDETEGRISHYRVRPAPKMPTHYVGRNATGSPCLLLKSDNDIVRSPIKLAGLEVYFGLRCKILIESDIARNEILTVLVCTSLDTKTQEYFLHVCQIILCLVGPNPALAVISNAVQRLVNLFQQLLRPARKSVIGLIGELYTINTSCCPKTAVEAWRNKEDDRFDFALDDVRLEVKTSSNRNRNHTFSLEQCTPPKNTIGILASLFIEINGGGLSLIELIHNIESRLGNNNELMLKVQETLVRTLGETLSLALTLRFDEALAKSSLLFYDVSEIPAIRTEIPGSVSQVRFNSDLSHTKPLTLQAAIAQSDRLCDLLPPA